MLETSMFTNFITGLTADLVVVIPIALVILATLSGLSIAISFLRTTPQKVVLTTPDPFSAGLSNILASSKASLSRYEKAKAEYEKTYRNY